MNSKKLLKILEEDGWKVVRVNGSHHHLKHPTKPGLVTVPHPKKDLPLGTVNSIRKQAGLNPAPPFGNNDGKTNPISGKEPL